MPLKAEDARKHLARLDAKLVKLEGEDLGGLVLIIPPEGDPIEFLSLNSHPTMRSFMQMVRDRIVASGETQDQFGAVRVPGR